MGHPARLRRAGVENTNINDDLLYTPPIAVRKGIYYHISMNSCAELFNDIFVLVIYFTIAVLFRDIAGCYDVAGDRKATFSVGMRGGDFFKCF
jgi:hypothetical protein